MTIGSAPNATVGGQPYHLSAPVPPSSHPQGAVMPAMTTVRVPSPPLSTTSPLMPLLDTPEPIIDTKRSANLVKPSTFFGPPHSSSPLMVPPVSSSTPTAPPLHPPGGLQRLYGAPLLQPFPPPTPPPSLTPTAASTPNFAPAITRDKIREALLVLVQVCITMFLPPCFCPVAEVLDLCEQPK